MAESNATQVILTDDGLKIIKAQNTANVAAGNINDINSDNKLTPSEKLKLKQEYDKDVKLYNIDIEQLKSVNLPTAELETAMSNLTNFVTPLFKEMNKTSTVERDALDSVFTAFATADKNASQAFVNMVQQVADDAKKAGDDAKEAGEKAQEAGEEAQASATQAKADAAQAKTDAATAQQKAQSSIDQLNAHLPDIDEALSTANLVKQDVTKLSNTTEQYHNEYTTGIQNVIKTIDDASTEIDQLNNAIKLKADSTDVTSQINVAIKGVQTDVTNKVSNLTTQINQTASAVQILNTTSGLRNLVYNSSYANNAEGWNMFNKTGYLSTLAVSSYNGSPGFGVNVSGKGASTWTEFGQSKFYTLPQPDAVDAHNTYSGSAMIKIYDDSDTSAKLSATIAYFDKSGARISGWKDMYVTYDKKNTWTLVKFENFPVPSGAQSIGMQYWAYGSKVHGMIAQPMIVFGPKVGPYNSDAAGQSDITASINNIHMGIKGADGSTSTFNMNNNTILLDANKIIINGNTSIQNGTIGTAKIANAAINTAQIADGAINNAKIANAAINDAKISNLNGNKIIAGSITANKINVDDLIANGINTKTLTSVNLNTSTLTTPQLNLGLNGTFNEDFDYTQPTSIFLPKKNTGTLTFNHGVLQSKGNMQTYVGGQWGGMNDNYTFQAGIDNSQWTEVAPGYIKLDLFKQNDTDVAERTYVDPTGFYYTTNGNQAYTSYVGNIVSTPQVQTSSVLTKYIGPSDGQNLLQIDNNGSHYGLQVGSYAGQEAVLSDYIYDFTASTASNVYITSNGHLARTTSASKYKYNISNPEYEDVLGDRLLNVHLASWNDKNAINSYAHTLSTGEDTEKISIDKYHGLIAEQLRDAGLGMFVEYNEDGEIEGIQYDRAWIPLLAVVRRLNNKINEYEMRISKLEEKNE
ncbi:hypothetical protein [Pediococcus acidilactici]|uniref:hypothetical protein n=1 Tax=Pediococcus acidilactici TaxID=1254 RepID=UPI002F2665C2